MSRVVVVTGGAKGIGRATVAAFAAHGDEVVALGRDAGRSARWASRSASPAGVETRTCDVTDEEQVADDLRRHRRGRRARQQRGRRRERPAGAHDARVAGPGTSRSTPPAPSSAPARCSTAMRERDERGDRHRRVDRRAASARPTRPPTPPPSTPRSGSCARPPPRWRVRGSAANAVCPTFVDTEMTQRVGAPASSRATGRDEASSEAALASASPLGRLLDPRGGGRPACSGSRRPTRPSINGQTMVLDGGGIQS